MKKVLLILLVLLLGFLLLGCGSAKAEQAPQVKEDNKETVTKLVEEFGSKLQNVSLLAPEDVLRKAMEENYGQYVAQALLAEWQKNPQVAPGKLTSSPWPDRIEIESADKLTDTAYDVKGYIIELTSVEKEKGGYAARRPITLKVEKSEANWLITEVSLGEYE